MKVQLNIRVEKGVAPRFLHPEHSLCESPGAEAAQKGLSGKRTEVGGGW